MRTGTAIHLKGLNGIRAIAALAVVYQHIIQNVWRMGLPALPGTDLGTYGVTIFFSLSGFLITYLLLLEKEKFGSINILSFYKRRILRIWPLYYLYLLLAGLVIWVWQVKALDGNYVFYFIMAANVPFFLYTAFPLIGHYWSLGVEEQFYLFWPWLIKKSENILAAISVFLLVFLALKALAWFVLVRSNISWPFRLLTLNRFDCMAIGALGAVLFSRKTGWFLKLSFNFFVQALPWIGIGLMAINRFHFLYTYDHDIAAILTVILIVNVVANEKVVFGLSEKPFEFLGKISYGIYIYHPLVIFFSYRFLNKYFRELSVESKYFVFFSIVLAGSILLAWISYEFFEKKFLLLKERFSLVRTRL